MFAKKLFIHIKNFLEFCIQNFAKLGERSNYVQTSLLENIKARKAEMNSSNGKFEIDYFRSEICSHRV